MCRVDSPSVDVQRSSTRRVVERVVACPVAGHWRKDDVVPPLANPGSLENQ